MNWKIKATLQKILSLSLLGDKLNHIPVTLSQEYHKNVFSYQSHECIRKFDYCKSDFLKKDRVALEIGTGYSAISVVVLRLLGFKKIVTVDVTSDLIFSSFKKQSKYLNEDVFLNEIVSKSIYSKNEILKLIDVILSKETFNELFEFLNVIYIAPYQFDDIEKHVLSIDYITSQVVLEHVHPDILNSLFEKTCKWLVDDGLSVHTINFIDHFANPGFFQDKSISEFNFLRFSDKYWNYWAGNSIAYTNRLSYVYYLELCEKNKLTVVDFIGENYRKRVELDSNLIHEDVLNKYEAIKCIDDLTKFQRGTLIISK
ncbi:hypothetical protein FIA58_015195 [Flavobacterium jejuense]|uniref:Methyltransferase type 11 domain-containing protein n=1 Tax=Flavobacterium jejuense TaxID=1544455 RepID=A0ABX0IWW6_9FLAO|nr:hypothetical protein [Flavobacterium jejuense]NHN27028.1 hypothetical protein [Flavobacterium jejuense]